MIYLNYTLYTPRINVDKNQLISISSIFGGLRKVKFIMLNLYRASC